MLTIPGYQLVAKLGEGTQSAVYRGFLNTAPDRPLSIKVFKTSAPTERQLAHYRQKVEHLRVLRDPSLLTAEMFELRGGVPFIVQDYFEGLSLDEWARRQTAVSLDAFFAIACQLAAALDKVHDAGIVHGGVKPHNVLVRPDNLEIRLTGFVTPLDVRDVSHFIFDPAFVSGTLAYTSPEQTGRIHHVVGFSSDLYSLGIVFYELLARRLPFRSTDPLALIHQHLAEEAPPIHEVNPEIPAALGRLVAKLTLKHPEKRYQSGRGLLADLVRCRSEWDAGRSIGRFALATQDRSRRVVFISKMVGRDHEACTVLDAFEPVTRGGFRAVFISGLPGIGKTRLIQELQQPIVRHRGYFTSGKFDIYQKNIPYSSLLQALRNLVRTFLTESPERVAAWKQRILDAVGPNGRVIIDVIPELEALLGPQPAVPPLPPVEARNRFHGLFDRFLGCLATAESPLTLFIDDLQWCDVASFDFLQTVFANPEEHPYLLLLGAYRHNEVDSGHPLARLIAKVQADRRPLEELRLRPLEPKHCHEMVSYILDAPLEHTEALAAFLADLTEGNPLFVSESLSYLYNEDLLYVDDELQWRWDLERIRKSNMPSTVVALFSAKIGRLPRPAVDLLETAACMGNTVPPADLARVADLPLLEVFRTLKPALAQGLVIENRDNLQFIHDRVQEAVLTAIPAERRREIHWRVGGKLLAAVPEGADLETLDNLFAIAAHLNLGRPQRLESAESWRLADLNFHAGEKALNSLATTAANEFFAKSKSLLPADCWEAEYEKTFRTYKKAAKAELMCGHPEQSDALLAALLQHARTDLDRAEALAEQTTSLSSIGNFIKAIATANRGLAFFEQSLPDDPEDANRRRIGLLERIRAAHPDVWREILDMPFTRDRKSKIELAFYSELIPDLYMSGLVPQLYLSAVQSTQHCLDGGMDESVIYSFSIMGLQLGEQEEFEQAFRYEDLARELSARHPDTFGATRGMNGIVWCNMHSRSRPEEIVEYCRRGIQCGRNCGDLYNAGLSYGPLMWNLQVQGRDLAAIDEAARECQRFSERNNLSFSVRLAEAVQAGWIAPMKKGYAPIPMADRVAQWEKDNHVAAAGSYYAHLAFSHYYFGEHEQATEALEGVRRYLSGLTDNVLKRQWYVFQALNALKLHERRPDAGNAGREAVLAELAPLVAKIETWAALGPLLQPYLAFLHAERERVTGSFERARGLYLDAIDCAHDHGYTFLEGHLNESLGEMLLAGGRGQARPFLLEAARLYGACRAERKELRVQERHPELFAAPATPAPAAREAPGPGLGQAPVESTVEAPATDAFALPQLDVGYLMRSALAISAEIEQEALLRRILQTVLESSGAQHGYLLVADGDHLWVRAEGHAGGGETVRIVGRRLEDAGDICTAVARYAFRTGQRLVLADAVREGEFKDNPQVQALGIRSLLCLPVVKQARLVGVLYLENRLAPAMFTPAGVQTTELLAAQAAISLENARLVEEMKRAEEALSAEREHLAVTLHSIGDAVIATDTGSRIVMLNRVAEELTGWPQAEASGKPLAEVFRIVNEQTGASAEDPVRKVLETGVVAGLANHTALVARDGRLLSIADSASPIRGADGRTLGVVLVFRDVTQARKAEEAVQEGRRLLQLIIDSIPACIAYVDREYRYRLVNRTYEQWFGLSPEWIRDRHAREVVGEAGWVAVRRDVDRALAGETVTYERQMPYPGGSRWVYATLTPDRDAAGRIRGVVVHVIDVGKLVEAETALREADTRKNEFLAMLSHELRNPLAPISNSLFVLDRAGEDGDRAKRAREVIARQVGHLSCLVDDLLDVTRISRNKIQIRRNRMDLCDVVRRVAEDQRSLFERGGVRLLSEIPAGPLILNADPTRVAQAVANLLQNAAKFTGRGGVTRVHVSSDPSCVQAVVRVTDTGIGMTPETLAGLFQPFVQADHTLDRGKGGLGLGLALVKGLVGLHGGEVTAHSEGLGKGAEFVVRLPLDPAARPECVPEAAVRPSCRRRVLIIEDNVDAADSLRDVLQLGGHEVAVANNGPDGIGKAREFRPEVVLCDIGLPGMDGYDVARVLRGDETLRGTCLVALSGYALPEDILLAREAGFAHHIPKPPSLEKIAELLASLPG
ncbi:MAG: AAA family ATPase [Deltaproteobacteria bacterium]|nr:AAA family ATPase [Deltaproteobacteria bacterium]